MTIDNTLPANSESNRVIQVWTDGSSIGNPGPSAWAALIDGQLHSGYLGYGTNNQAEISAIYHSIPLLPANCYAIIHTDSKLAIGWLQMGWKINTGTIRAYKALIDDLVGSCGMHISYVLVRGHSGIYENEIVNATAQAAARQELV